MSSAEDSLPDIPYESLGPLGEHLLVCRDRALSHRTIRERMRILLHLEKHAGVALVEATEIDVRRWWRSLSRRRGLSASSRGVYLSHARGFYAWAVREGLRDDDPTRRIDPPKRADRLPRDLDPGRAINVVRFADLGPVAGLAAQLALEAGLRREEIATLRTPRDVIRRETGPVLRVFGKGKRERMVPITDDVAAKLLALPKGWVFPSSHGSGKHLTPDHLGEKVRDALAAAGLESTLHPLRHTAAMQVLAHTDDIERVRLLLGHKTLAATQVYARHRGVPRDAVVGVWDSLLAGVSPSRTASGLIEVRQETPNCDSE